MTPIHLVLLPGLDGTGILFRPLLKLLPAHIVPVVVEYPRDKALGYAELLPLVLSALPERAPFVLLGESFGGPLSLLAAATRPHGLKAVILCASFVSCPHHFVPAWAAKFVWPLPFRAFPKLAQIKALLGGYSTESLLSLSHEALSSVRPEVFAFRTREVIKVDVTPELAALNLPLLYIQGQFDHVVPGGNLKRIQEIKPMIEVAQLPAPHMVLQTQPEAAVEAIVGFIARSVRPDSASDK